jgi:membrane protein implicated in regulation of membrane protease activity
VLAAGLVVAAVAEGSWYWWAGAIAAAILALINLSVYWRTERERRRPPDASMFVKRPPEPPMSGR